MVVSLSAIATIMPIISFLFIFILIYALLAETKVLGENNVIAVFIALVVASFFIVEVRLVEFTNLSVSWVVAFIVCLVLIMMMLGFAGKDVLKVVAETNAKGFAAVIVIGVILVFVFSSMYVFNWAINWDLIQSWFDKEWFGMVLLVVLAGLVAWKIVPAVATVAK